MLKNAHPRFIIYQPNEEEYHICLEAKGAYLRWCSKYAPTLDVAFPREINRIADMPLKSRPKKQIYDEGTYTIPKAKTKEQIEEKLQESLKDKSFSFSLKGKLLNGRFSIKQSRVITVIQKYKDKYAREEDVLSGDLIRTINTMVPDYDESKVNINEVHKKVNKKAQNENATPIEEITADKAIAGKDYHFAFYSSNDNDDAICLVTNPAGECLVLKRKGKQWNILLPASKAALKTKQAFTAHARALYDLQTNEHD